MNVDAVAFDIDGTLYPNSRMYLNSALFSLSRMRFLYHFRIVRKQIRDVRPLNDFRAVQANLLSERMKVPEKKAKERIEHAIYSRWQRVFRNIRPYPYLSDLLVRLKAEGYALGVMSDFPVGDKLAHLALPQVWDFIMTSEDTGYLKPNPEPFLALSSALGTVPGRILYVGNSYKYDIIGANRVGMKTAHIARESAENSVADITFDDYRTLEALLLDVART
ncbi:MAG: HAD family hydrolase [Spirochaetales bacterium]|nr:HAD family hydrolase [Spirochaetales bacterium]